MSSIVQKILAEKGVRLEHIELSGADGKDYFIVMFVKEADYPKYKQAIDSGKKFNPEEHGVVVMAGEGEVDKVELEKAAKQLLEGKR